jgi:hypothetical protein
MWSWPIAYLVVYGAFNVPENALDSLPMLHSRIGVESGDN